MCRVFAQRVTYAPRPSPFSLLFLHRCLNNTKAKKTRQELRMKPRMNCTLKSCAIGWLAFSNADVSSLSWNSNNCLLFSARTFTYCRMAWNEVAKQVEMRRRRRRRCRVQSKVTTFGDNVINIAEHFLPWHTRAPSPSSDTPLDQHLRRKIAWGH